MMIVVQGRAIDSFLYVERGVRTIRDVVDKVEQGEKIELETSDPINIIVTQLFLCFIRKNAFRSIDRSICRCVDLVIS